MHSYTISDHRRNKQTKRSGRRSIRWHGPRFVRGRRSSRITAVWVLRARYVSSGVSA